MTKLSLALAITVLCSACATMQPALPESYRGPVAKVKDSMANVTSKQGDFCVLHSIDGRPISNAINETIERGRGMGLNLHAWLTDRRIPAAAVRAGLKCQTVHAAPILAMIGTVQSVEGTVDFAPKPDGSYIVKGVLAPTGSSVWIEDAGSGEVVTAKVTSAKQGPVAQRADPMTGRSQARVSSLPAFVRSPSQVAM
ncbi:hypothetical protein ABXN37_07995 [Piscinibacter sakaiensis]|uniref:FlgO domain-containing protein n=1 Tax=Piscinibacter sakaiensis TaxID=1547922 RepID=A0A0K8NXH0_PISS1|nr:hypothetical protein [Piscinibacter sakaiensis]GAP35097.1 hypothetical protein ISF6_0662 [Piscinibacter sakaiensis]